MQTNHLYKSEEYYIQKRIHLKKIDSTNNYARTLLDKGELLPDITLIDADVQEAGRGQKGNSWEAEQDKNLLFSLVCHPTNLPPARQFILSQCISLAIKQALSRYVDNITIKWPNDIYYCDKKICGILIECDLLGKNISNCIIGCGININQETFTSDAPNPTSLRIITGKDFDREAILLEITANFLTLYKLITNQQDDIISKMYMQNLYRKSGFYMYSDCNGVFEAEISNVEPTGHLNLHLKNGEIRRYEFKEIKFILPQQ